MQVPRQEDFFVDDWRVSPSMGILARGKEIARLEASLGVASSSSPRVRRLDAASARSAVDAAYLAEWRRRFPDAEVHVFKDAGHYVLEDAGGRIIPLIKNFLKKHPL